jgi:cysteine desulfurase
MKKSIYLDHAAATPLDPAVLLAMRPYWQEQFYNPSAAYLAAQAVAKDVLAAREKVAHWLGARPSEVIFTAGGTEADNLAIHGIMQKYPQAKVAVSAVEHEAILEPAKQYIHTIIPVNSQGLVEPETLAKLIDDQTVLVSIMYANNEVGTIQPIRRIAQVLGEIKAQRKAHGNNLPLYFHTDASQAAGYLDIHTARLCVDLMTINGGKIYGPKQTGALYVKAGIELSPQVRGGGQERSLRSGTENVAGIVGLSVALDSAQQQKDTEGKRLCTLRDHAIKLLEQAIPHVIINGSRKHRLPNNIHLTIPGADNERLVMQLDEAGIQCAAGSACTASNDEPSHVLKAMGLSDQNAQSSLRLSLGRSTTQADIDYTIQTLSQITNSQSPNLLEA